MRPPPATASDTAVGETTLVHGRSRRGWVSRPGSQHEGSGLYLGGDARGIRAAGVPHSAPTICFRHRVRVQHRPPKPVCRRSPSLAPDSLIVTETNSCCNMRSRPSPVRGCSVDVLCPPSQDASRFGACRASPSDSIAFELQDHGTYGAPSHRETCRHASSKCAPVGRRCLSGQRARRVVAQKNEATSEQRGVSAELVGLR